MYCCNERDIAAFNRDCLGSKYYNTPVESFPSDDEAYEAIRNTPSVWVGEVSWLKAALLGHKEEFVPGVVEQIDEVIGEDLPVIDDALIAKINKAFDAGNTTGYGVAKREKVLSFLEEYRGERAFTVSW